jgi:hypothetical protein
MQLNVSSNSGYSRVFGWIEFQDVKIKNRNTSLILRIIFFLLFFGSFVFSGFTGFSVFLVSIITFSVLGLFIVLLLTLRYFDWPAVFFFLVIVGLFYKNQHWPFSASLVALGASVLAIFAWYNAFKFIYTFRKNVFLRWFGSVSQFVVVFFMIGYLYKFEQWPYGDLILSAGSFLFVFSILALVFTLPFSDYVSWTDVDRKVFFRTILIPLVFILIIFTLFYVFPDTYNSLVGKTFKAVTLYFPPAELMQFEGI